MRLAALFMFPTNENMGAVRLFFMTPSHTKVEEHNSSHIELINFCTKWDRGIGRKEEKQLDEQAVVTDALLLFFISLFFLCVFVCVCVPSCVCVCLSSHSPLTLLSRSL